MNRRKFLGSGVGIGMAAASGRWLEAAATESGIPIRLNANENALGLSPAAREAAARALGESHRYPFTGMFGLIEQLAKRESISPKNILLGNGSSELLRLTVQAYSSPAPLIITAHPTYEAIGSMAELLGLDLERIPLTSRQSHDLEAMEAAARKRPGPKLVYICNPNNPTATLSSSHQLEQWLNTASPETLFLIDEAYHHYVEDPSYRSLLELAAASRNVIVTRTFSKVYAMAGMRLGFAVSHPETIEKLSRLTRLNINNVALSAGAACLEDRAFLSRSVAANEESKKLLSETLAKLELSSFESHTNFVMFEVNGATEDFAARMRAENMLVGRPFPLLTRFSRVSLGTLEEMGRFCETLHRFRHKGWI